MKNLILYLSYLKERRYKHLSFSKYKRMKFFIDFYDKAGYINHPRP